MDFARVLHGLTDYFAERGFRWAVVGGVAMAAYGFPRTTLDLDFLVERKDQDAVVSTWKARDTGRFIDRKGTRTTSIPSRPAVASISSTYPGIQRGASSRGCDRSKVPAAPRFRCRAPSTSPP